MSRNDAIASHYTTENALARIDEQLRAQGIDPEHPTLEALAPYDNFHSRGLGAVIDQIALADYPGGARVLDVGGGLGGPARVLASRADVHVTVLDLTPQFIEYGRILTERVGLADKVVFELGDATRMPFADATFDGAWTQHSTMNIADKDALYAEIHRVLKPGGRLAMHEVLAGNGSPVHFPVPWADWPEISFLLDVPTTRSLIEAAGFREVVWSDESEAVLAFLERAAAEAQSPGQAVLLGTAFSQRLQNFGRNLRDGALVVVRAAYERLPS